ncbi:MAG: hypothetical protein ABI785_07950 [Gemmatimonadales bacterium]
MPKIRSGRPAAGLWCGWSVLVAASAVVVGSGCGERDRLTFPSLGDGVGPVTLIDHPGQSDTLVLEGTSLIVFGRTVDPDGVDTVYFLVSGGDLEVPPFVFNPPLDTVQFGVPITTAGRAGRTILVQVHGVDAHGNIGTTSTRQISIQ